MRFMLAVLIWLKVGFVRDVMYQMAEIWVYFSDEP